VTVKRIDAFQFLFQGRPKNIGGIDRILRIEAPASRLFAKRGTNALCFLLTEFKQVNPGIIGAGIICLNFPLDFSCFIPPDCFINHEAEAERLSALNIAVNRFSSKELFRLP
jgi:hypothetical protein